MTGTVYIGQSVDIQKRWQQHLQAAKKGNNPSLLYAAMNKFSIENFVIDVVEETDDLDERERYWIAFYRNIGPCYNRKQGGQKAPPKDIDPNYVSPFDRRLYYQLQELRERNKYEK